MKCAERIEDDKIALLPVVSVDPLAFCGVNVQLFQQGIALVSAHAKDSPSEPSTSVEDFATRLGVA